MRFFATLCFLPIRDAVRTSVLSSRWIHLFASMSTLDFMFLHFRDDDTQNQFKNSVDRLLFFPREVGLECFRLGFGLGLSWDNDYARLYGWICAVLCRGVKELDLWYVDLPTHLFSSQSLVTLKLWRTGHIPVPTNVRLPNLKTLHLFDFAWSDVPRLISNCVVLEELLIISQTEIGSRLSEIDSSSPSLKRLDLNVQPITGFRSGYEYMVKSLEKAYLVIAQPLDDTSYNLNGERSATHLLRAIGNVRSLSLNLRLVEMLSTTPLERVLAFPNLVELEFREDVSDWKGMNLVEFLHCVPNLETLILDTPTFPEACCRAVPKTVPSCLLFHLMEIKISYIVGGEHLFDLVSYFLKNALVLEKLIISGSPYDEQLSTSILAEKVSSLPKELSKKCQLVTP